jgi:hypothetical protein
MSHHWDVVFVDGHQLAFDAESLEACSGSGVLRACDDARESILLIKGGWSLAIRDGLPVTVTAAPPAPPPESPGRPFA